MPKPPDLIATETISEIHCKTLSALLDTMIPPDVGLAVPGAGDDKIVSQVVKSIRAASIQTIVDGLTDIERAADASTGRNFSDLNPQERERWFHGQALAKRDFVRILGTIAIQCYYCDPRVMKSLGMESRAPFPKGFRVEQGDWSLLDPVKVREKIYRDVS